MIKSALVRKLLAGAGVTACLILLAVSSTLNFDYGFSLGGKWLSAVAFGLAFVQADVIMAISPFFFFAAKQNRQWSKMLTSGLLWLSMTAICAWCAVAQIGFHRDEASSNREVAVIGFDDLRKEIAEARKELGFIPAARPELTIRADIDGLKTKTLWFQTSECDEASIQGKTAREFCQGYARLKAELGAALQAEKVRKRIADLVAKSEHVSESKGGQVVGQSDAAASTWSNLTGLSIGKAKAITAGMSAGLLLIVGMVGLFTFVGTLRAPDPEAPPVADLKPGAPPPVPQASFEALLAAEAEKLALEAPAAELLPPPRPEPEPPPAPEKPMLEVNPGRPEPLPEARRLLDAIGFPTRPLRGELRDKGDREVVGWRFYTWLVAYGLKGEYPWQAVDELYGEFAKADHREPWGLRVAKVELEKVRWVTKVEKKNESVLWSITHPKNLDQLNEALIRRGIIGPEVTAAEAPNAARPEEKAAEPLANSNVIPYVGPTLRGAS